MDARAFWKDVLAQNRGALAGWFRPDAVIRWPCTNEQFSVPEYVRVNCDYPGAWDGEVERLEGQGDRLTTVVRVYPRDRSASYHAISFFQLKDGLVAALDEYWADDGDAPAWRKSMGVGRPIR